MKILAYIIIGIIILSFSFLGIYSVYKAKTIQIIDEQALQYCKNMKYTTLKEYSSYSITCCKEQKCEKLLWNINIP